MRLMLWLDLSIIRAARERSALLPELDTAAFRPPEGLQSTTHKDIEEYVRQVHASKSKRRYSEYLVRASDVPSSPLNTVGSFIRLSSKGAPSEVQGSSSEMA